MKVVLVPPLSRNWVSATKMFIKQNIFISCPKSWVQSPFFEFLFLKNITLNYVKIMHFLGPKHDIEIQSFILTLSWSGDFVFQANALIFGEQKGTAVVS